MFCLLACLQQKSERQTHFLKELTKIAIHQVNESRTVLFDFEASRDYPEQLGVRRDEAVFVIENCGVGLLLLEGFLGSRVTNRRPRISFTGKTIGRLVSSHQFEAKERRRPDFVSGEFLDFATSASF